MTSDPEVSRRLDHVEQALWGSERDPASGLVSALRRVEAKLEEGRRQQTMIMAGVVVAIITPAATILLARAAG